MEVDMGTREEADARFMSACDTWIALRQPLISSAAGHKKRDMSEHEARFQLANAAIHLAWFMRRDLEAQHGAEERPDWSQIQRS